MMLCHQVACMFHQNADVCRAQRFFLGVLPDDNRRQGLRPRLFSEGVSTQSLPF